MKYIILFGVIGALTTWYFFFRQKKIKPAVVLPAPKKRMLVLHDLPPSTMHVGDRFQLDWEVTEAGEKSFVTIYWRVERPPEIPVGSPDLPVIFVDAGGMITALGGLGTRKVHAEFSDTPGKPELTFEITVI